MDHVWTVFCSKVIIDNQSGQISIIDIIEAMTTTIDQEAAQQIEKAGPAGASSLFEAVLVSLWTRSNPNEPEKAEVRFSLFDPKGERTKSDSDTGTEIDLTKYVRYRSLARITALPLRGSGRYVFKVEMKAKKSWKVVAQIPYDVTIDLDPTAPRP